MHLNDDFFKNNQRGEIACQPLQNIGPCAPQTSIICQEKQNENVSEQKTSIKSGNTAKKFGILNNYQSNVQNNSTIMIQTKQIPSKNATGAQKIPNPLFNELHVTFSPQVGYFADKDTISKTNREKIKLVFEESQSPPIKNTEASNNLHATKYPIKPIQTTSNSSTGTLLINPISLIRQSSKETQ